jgi:hypothetical protein
MLSESNRLINENAVQAILVGPKEAKSDQHRAYFIEAGVVLSERNERNLTINLVI